MGSKNEMRQAGMHTVSLTKRSSSLCLTLGILLMSASAWAGRPLDTEDAATAEPHTCQIEVWRDHQASARSSQVAVACGVAQGLELGWGQSRAWDHGLSANALSAQGLAIKWVPTAWRLALPDALWGGEVQAGVKAEVTRSPDEGLSALAVQSMASWRIDADWSVHANLGVQRLSSLSSTAAQVRLAVVWAPHPRALLFAEAAASQHPQWFGGRSLALGGRWWLLTDQLGLDLKASQEAGIAATRWSLGLGWYGW